MSDPQPWHFTTWSDALDHWQTIIAGFLALLAAVGTIWVTLRAGPKLRFKVQPDVQAPWLPPTTIIQIAVTNYGDRPTTLTNMTIRYFKHRRWEWLRNRATKEVVCGLSNVVLPYELKPEAS
jgi:hypothetical protein